MLKRCCTCKVEKGVKEFDKDNSRKDQLDNKCKECSAAYTKKWYEKKIQNILNNGEKITQNILNKDTRIIQIKSESTTKIGVQEKMVMEALTPLKNGSN